MGEGKASCEALSLGCHRHTQDVLGDGATVSYVAGQILPRQEMPGPHPALLRLRDPLDLGLDGWEVHNRIKSFHRFIFCEGFLRTKFGLNVNENFETVCATDHRRDNWFGHGRTRESAVRVKDLPVASLAGNWGEATGDLPPKCCAVSSSYRLLWLRTSLNTRFLVCLHPQKPRKESQNLASGPQTSLFSTALVMSVFPR